MAAHDLDLPFGWEPWTAPALEDLIPRLSTEEQVRLHKYMRDNKRIRKGNLAPCSEGARDFIMISDVRYALRHYNARHPGEEFDAVKPLMAATAFSKGHNWYHLNFWACCRKSKKIKRFFAEVHYKTVFSSSVRSHQLPPVPAAEKPPSSSSSVGLDLPPPVPGDEKPPGSRNSVCLDLPPPVPGVEKPPSSNGLNLTVFAPIVETCIIMEEPLGQYWKSCAFCPGHFGILHPKGRKFVCGNDKDRMVQGIERQGISGLKMPFTCQMGLDSNNGHA